MKTRKRRTQNKTVPFTISLNQQLVQYDFGRSLLRATPEVKLLKISITSYFIFEIFSKLSFVLQYI